MVIRSYLMLLQKFVNVDVLGLQVDEIVTAVFAFDDSALFKAVTVVGCRRVFVFVVVVHGLGAA